MVVQNAHLHRPFLRSGHLTAHWWRQCKDRLLLSHVSKLFSVRWSVLSPIVPCFVIEVSSFCHALVMPVLHSTTTPYSFLMMEGNHNNYISHFLWHDVIKIGNKDVHFSIKVCKDPIGPKEPLRGKTRVIKPSQVSKTQKSNLQACFENLPIPFQYLLWG